MPGSEGKGPGVKKCELQQLDAESLKRCTTDVFCANCDPGWCLHDDTHLLALPNSPLNDEWNDFVDVGGMGGANATEGDETWNRLDELQWSWGKTLSVTAKCAWQAKPETWALRVVGPALNETFTARFACNMPAPSDNDSFSGVDVTL